MSELKATTAYDAYWKTNSVGEGTSIQVYLKSEADNHILYLNARIAQLEEETKWLYKINAHQKYKRCLAMADYSMYHHFRMLEIYGKRLDNDRAVFKINFGLKWHYRWLELAERFKEVE